MQNGPCENMTALTLATVFSQAYSTIYGILSNQTTGLTDIQNPARTRSTWIHADYPDEKGSDWNGYPVVTIDCDSSSNIETLAQSHMRGTLTATIVVFVKKNSDLDTLSGNVLDLIFNSTSKATLEAGGLHSPRVSGTRQEVIVRANDALHVRTFTVEFTWVV